MNFASLVPKTAKQEAEACSPVRWDWVEASVWTERMLAALGNGVKGGKWYSLIDKVYNPKTLKAAWKKVASNRGAAGVDKISIKRFRSNAQFYLEELERELRNGTFQAICGQTGTHPQRREENPAPWGYQPSKIVSFRPL